MLRLAASRILSGLFPMSLAAWLFAGYIVAADGPKYSVTKSYTLGGEGGWDYLKYDTDAHRLFITRGTHVIVVDPETGKQIGEIPDTPGVHGVAFAPELGKGFTSNGRANSVTIFDLKDLHATGTAKTGEVPDAITYDAVSRRVFTFNARSHDATAIDAATGTPVGSVPLGGKPEFAVADGQGRIFVNIEDTAEIVAFDTRKLAVEHRWPMNGCEEPSGLALDAQHRRLFSGCGNKVMTIVNADTGAIVAQLPIGDGVDATAFDAGTQLAFSSNGAGTLTVIKEETPDKFSVVENVETARGARTMTLDPQTHRVFVVTAEFGPPPAATAEQPHPRPPIVPGSFKLLKLELAETKK